MMAGHHIILAKNLHISAIHFIPKKQNTISVALGARPNLP